MPIPEPVLFSFHNFVPVHRGSRSLGLVLALIQTNADCGNQGQIDAWGYCDKILCEETYVSTQDAQIDAANRLLTQRTVCLSPKIWRTLKKLLEMCATGRPPKVILADRSNQSPVTSNSISLPSDWFWRWTVDRDESTRLSGHQSLSTENPGRNHDTMCELCRGREI